MQLIFKQKPTPFQTSLDFSCTRSFFNRHHFKLSLQGAQKDEARCFLHIGWSTAVKNRRDCLKLGDLMLREHSILQARLRPLGLVGTALQGLALSEEEIAGRPVANGENVVLVLVCSGAACKCPDHTSVGIFLLFCIFSPKLAGENAARTRCRNGSSATRRRQQLPLSPV